MRYSSTINNLKASEWGLSIQQAYLFSWFYELPSWANKVMIENEIFYFASKNKAVEELPILTDKTDTMYRYYKQLEELDLIVIKKIDNKDYVSLTSKAREWNFHKSEDSENNPSLFGNLSESNSEKNPTYNNIIHNNKKDNNIEKIDFDFLLEYFNNTFERKVRVFPVKAKKQFNERLKEGYNKADIKNVIINVKQSDFHKNLNYSAISLEFLSRSKTFELYSGLIPKKEEKGGHINH